MFKNLILCVAGVKSPSVMAQEPPPIAKDTALVVVAAWRVLPDGKEDGRGLPSAYLGLGPVREKESTGSTVAKGVSMLAGAILPIPTIKTKVTDLLVGGDPKNDVALSGPCVGFILYGNDVNAKWGKSFRLVRLDPGPQGRFFQMEDRGKVAESFDLSDSVKMLQSKQGNWYLKLLKPLDPARYAVANLFGKNGICWYFDVTERLTPQDSPSELPKDDGKK